MDQENKTITAPSGKELGLRSFVNARQRNELRSVLLDSVVVDPANPTKPTIPALGGELLDKYEKKMIGLVVVSYDGKTEPAEILEALLNGSPEDYDFAVAESGKIANFRQAK